MQLIYGRGRGAPGKIRDKYINAAAPPAYGIHIMAQHMRRRRTMEQYFPFQTTQLPFSYVALMPHCDANTLYYHHGQYYDSEVYRLNQLAVRHRLTQLSLTQLLTEDIQLPAAQLRRLRSTAGAVFNHQLYFEGMTCQSGQPPVNSLTAAIIAAYGSMPRFQQLMLEAAQSIIGSGWVWLVVEGDQGIHIATTENNDVVALASVTPLLIMDIWEHAYQTQAHTGMAEYVENWFSLIDWGVANQRYLEAGGAQQGLPAGNALG